MNYEQYILNELLDKYERSLNYREDNKIKRGVYLEWNVKTFPEYFKDTTSKYKTAINVASEILERKGFLEIFWMKHEKGNIIKKVRLIIEKSEEIYEYINRASKREKEQTILGLLLKYAIEVSGWAQEFYSHIRSSLENGQGIGVYIDTDNYMQTEMIFKAVNCLFNLKEELPARVFSIRLYGNSKKFEKIKGKVTRILRDFRKLDEIEEGEDILSICGIVDNPKHVYFSGNLKVEICGQTIDFSLMKPDIGLSSESIDIIDVKELNVDYVISIENLTSYHEFIRKTQGNFLAIYLGGYPGMAEIKFIKKLKHIIEQNNVPLLHWSDIDYGGFSIFNYLTESTGMQIIPLLMNIEVLKEYFGAVFQFDYSYKAKLNKMLEEPKYSIFSEVIKYIIENSVRLEQECIDIARVKEEISKVLEKNIRNMGEYK